MPVYFYWGDDEFALSKAAQTLRDRTLAPEWASFNEDKISGDQANAVITALNQAMTPPFGIGGRFTWLDNTNLGQQCPADTLAELERTLSQIPDNSTLLLTSSSKPDGRLKSTKLLQKQATIQEFSAIPPWKGDLLAQKVRQAAQEVGLKLTKEGIEFLVEAVGNDTRQLYNELDKLKCFPGDSTQPLDMTTLTALVSTTTQNSLQLAAALREGQVAEALELVASLLGRNEPALRVVATLIGQFRTWLWVKLMTSLGERDERTIAQAAEIANPKRIYFLQQEVRPLSLKSLQQAMPLLLELEVSLKQGADAEQTLQTKVIQLCQLMATTSR